MVHWCYTRYRVQIKSSLLEKLLRTPPAKIRSIGWKLNNIQWLLWRYLKGAFLRERKVQIKIKIRKGKSAHLYFRTLTYGYITFTIPNLLCILSVRSTRLLLRLLTAVHCSVFVDYCDQCNVIHLFIDSCVVLAVMELRVERWFLCVLDTSYRLAYVLGRIQSKLKKM